MTLTDILETANRFSTFGDNPESDIRNSCAIALYERVDQHTPISRLDDQLLALESLNGWGRSHACLSQFEEAIERSSQALKINPNSTFAFNTRAFAEMRLGRFEEAILDLTRAIDRAIELDPSVTDTYLLRGHSYYALNRFEDAIADYDKAIELDPNVALTYHNRGFAKNGLGKFEDAIADYDKAIELEPNKAVTYQGRGFAKNSLGKFEDAIADYNKSIELDPKNWWSYLLRADLLVKQQQWEQAKTDCDTALQLAPDKVPRAYFHRAQVYEHFGDPDAARGDYLAYIDAIKDEHLKYPETIGRFRVAAERLTELGVDQTETLKRLAKVEVRA